MLIIISFVKSSTSKLTDVVQVLSQLPCMKEMLLKRVVPIITGHAVKVRKFRILKNCLITPKIIFKYRVQVVAYANNKGTDQSAHPRCLIIVRCFDNIIPIICYNNNNNSNSNKTLFQEDNIFGTNASLTYGPQIQRHTCV